MYIIVKIHYTSIYYTLICNKVFKLTKLIHFLDREFQRKL